MQRFESGFALPTILISSVVMLIVLVSAVSAVASVRASLDQQNYNQLAREAAESGVVRAVDCLKNNSYTTQWTNLLPLRPNSSCTGSSTSCTTSATCLLSKTNYRTYFRVFVPGDSGNSQTIESYGTVQLLRPNGTVYREYKAVASARVAKSTSVDDVDVIIFGQ